MNCTAIAAAFFGLLWLMAEPAAAPPTRASAVPDTIETPKWKRVPSGQELSCYFPQRALSMQHTRGQAQLNCKVDERGWLHECKILQESPQNFAFGAAARAVAERALELELSDGHGDPVAGRAVAVGLNFKFVEPGDCSRFLKNRHPGS